jgi:hypothetical protein
MGSTYITDYPAELYLTSDASATVKVDGWYVRILRKNINIITVDYQVDDATTTTKGIVRLAGDLSGTANNPTVPALANKVNTSRNINTTSPLLGGGNLSTDLTLSIQQANSTQSGYLNNVDWSHFESAYNDKIVSAAVTGTTTKTLRLSQLDGGFIEANWTDDNSVTSVFGRTGAVVAVSGDYTTSLVTEGSNLYYTESRVSANTDVAANTAKRHDAATLGTSNGLSLSGQVLSLALSGATTNGALSSTDWTRFDGKQGALTFTSPLVNTAGVVSIPVANTTVDGYLSGADWTRFDNKQPALIGVGFVKISGTTISYDNSTYVPTSRTITINGTGFDLSANRSWTIPTHDAVTVGTPANGLSLSGQVLSLSVAHSLNTGALSSTDWTTFNNKQNALNGTGFVKVSGTTVSYDNSTYVPTSRIITINGTGFDLSENRTFNVGTVTSVAALTLGTTGTDVSSSVANGTTTPVITLNIPTSSATNRGALSSTDWTTFNNKQNAIAHLEFNNTNKTIWNNGFGNTSYNTSFGELALVTNTAGYENTAYGYNSLNLNTQGSYNTAVGVDSLTNNTLGSYNTANGSDSLRGNSTGSYNTAIGDGALRYSATGSYNSALGGDAGSLTSGGLATLTINNSVFVGVGTRALNQSGDTNQIVIGYNAVGVGSNSVVLGNDSITKTILKGNVGIGTTSPSAKLEVNGHSVLGGALNSTWAVGVSNTGTTDAHGMYVNIGASSTGVPFAVYKNFNPLLFVSNTGNVGIGTTSPSAKLSVSNAVSTTATVMSIGTSNNGLNFIINSNGSPEIASAAAVAPIYFSQGSTRVMTLSDNGNVGIGATSPTEKLTVATSSFPAASFYRDLDVLSVGPAAQRILIGARKGSVFTSGASITGVLEGDGNNGNIAFDTLSSGTLTERMRITSGGNVLINGTSNFGIGKLEITYNGQTQTALDIKTTYTEGNNLRFINSSGSVVGSIYSSSTLTAYFTTSDYRLKQDLKPINGLDLVSKIKVYDYEWKLNKTRSYGVLAHELQQVIPEAVNGDKDDEQMQQVDYSKLVPILVQAIKELKAEIEILKTK